MSAAFVVVYAACAAVALYLSADEGRGLRLVPGPDGLPVGVTRRRWRSARVARVDAEVTR